MPVIRSSTRSFVAKLSTNAPSSHVQNCFVTSTATTRRSGNVNNKVKATAEEVASLPSAELVVKEFEEIGKRLQHLPRERLTFDESTSVTERCRKACYFRQVDPKVLGVSICVTRSGNKVCVSEALESGLIILT
jgi:hypothetical protein